MPAWTPANIWETAVITEYRRFIVRDATATVGSLRSTCEDLALRLTIEFAASHLLPFQIVNGAYPGGLDPTDFGSVSDFRTEVLRTTGAKDLVKPENVTVISRTGLAATQPGDLLVLDEGHVQIVTANSGGRVTIAQGGFRPKDEWCNIVRRNLPWRDRNRPGDTCYIGAIVGQKAYTFDAAQNEWTYPGRTRRTFTSLKGVAVVWNFARWNARVPATP